VKNTTMKTDKKQSVPAPTPRITKESIKNFAKQNYTQNLIEFEKDYLIIKYLKGQLNKFINNKKINKRLVLNYIITLNNVFVSPYVVVKILFLECDKEVWGVLATFLKFLNLLPERIYLGKRVYINTEAIIDHGLLESLNEL